MYDYILYMCMKYGKLHVCVHVCMYMYIYNHMGCVSISFSVSRSELRLHRLMSASGASISRYATTVVHNIVLCTVFVWILTYSSIL